MLNVNNKSTILKLSKSSYKSNKMRNLFAIVAIVLTTILFTGLFTIAGSLLASMEESTMRQVGGSAHGGFKYLTLEQYEKLKDHKSIKKISYTVILGIAENNKLAKRPTEIRYVKDELGAEQMFSLPSKGRLPQNDNEIATDTIVLKSLGIPAELGQTVTLEYSLNGKKYADAFKLVGFWEGDKLMQASQAFLSKSYVEKQLLNYVPADNDIFGTINADVSFANSHDIEGKMKKVIADSGFKDGEIRIGVNWAYTGNNGSIDTGTKLAAAVAILSIIFCGYLIISNVFYISVAKDIRFYGLLKTIGTTGKQIRFLIRRQALLLCMIGIPLGLLAGYFVGAALTPAVLSTLNTNVIKVSIEPIAFVASAMFAIFTVVISVLKPSKIAAKVSPIEALRSTDGTQKSKKAFKKSSGINLWNMAQGNVFRNKKKAIAVTISLSLSLVILNSAYSIANGFDMDKYLSGMIGSDFAVGDVSNFNVHIDYSNQDTLNTKFLAELSEKNGIEAMSNIYFDEALVATDPCLMTLTDTIEKKLDIQKEWLNIIKQDLQNHSVSQHIYGLDQVSMNKLTVFQGSIDFEKLKTGKYVIAAPYDESGKVNYYNVGDKVNITNAAGVSREYEVLAVAIIPYNISNQHSHPITLEFYFPHDVFLSDIAEKSPMLTTLDVLDEYEAEMDSYLSDYCENVDPNMQYKSKAIFIAEYENTQQMYKTVGMILSLLVGFIGIMNFTNTVITSIMSRKRELAMLQSIGMTEKQTQVMLICEGLVYIVLTTIFALTVGSVMGYFGVEALLGGGAYFSLRFTVLPAIICLPILVAISILVPCVSGKMLTKNSVVERLREVE